MHRTDSGKQPVSDRAEHPENVADADHHERAWPGLTITRASGPTSICWCTSRPCGSTTSRTPGCARAPNTPDGRSGKRWCSGPSRLQRQHHAEPGRQHDGGDRQLQPEPDDVPRRDVGRSGNEQAGCALNGNGAKFCTPRASDEPELQPDQRRPRRFAVPVSRCGRF